MHPYEAYEYIQGDPSGWLKPPVDLVPKVTAADTWLETTLRTGLPKKTTATIV